MCHHIKILIIPGLDERGKPCRPEPAFNKAGIPEPLYPLHLLPFLFPPGHFFPGRRLTVTHTAYLHLAPGSVSVQVPRELQHFLLRLVALAAMQKAITVGIVSGTAFRLTCFLCRLHEYTGGDPFQFLHVIRLLTFKEFPKRIRSIRLLLFCFTLRLLFNVVHKRQGIT